MAETRALGPGAAAPWPGSPASAGAAPSARTTAPANAARRCRRYPLARLQPSIRRRSAGAEAEGWLGRQGLLRADEVTVGLDAEAAADLAQLVVERPGVRPLLALVHGRSALELHAAGVVADSGDRPQLGLAQRRAPAETAASSARLASTGFASGPASWISVGATQATAGWASVQAHESCSIVSPCRSAIGRSSSSRARPGLDPARGPVAAVIASVSSPSSGTSSWNSPP